MRLRPKLLTRIPLATLLLAACSSSDAGLAPSDATATAPSLVSIQPMNASASVNPGAAIVLGFNHSMMSGMEMLVVLHEGSVTGSAVTTTATWSTDRRTLTLMPSMPLKRTTTYVVHLSPTLKDTDGRMINMSSGTMMGGQAVSGSMMGGGSMMNGQWGPGMMGAGWQAANGTFGMIFSFTTA